MAAILSMLLLALSSIASAQETLEARVQRELHELEQMLAKAKEVLATFDNREARGYFDKAELLRKEAETKYNQALLAAANSRAREILLKDALANIALAKGLLSRVFNVSLNLPVTRLRNTLGELMRRAEQSVLNSGNREAQRLVHEARKRFAEGERAYARMDYRKAVELLQLAIALVEKALNLVEGRKATPEATPETLISREKERYINLETRAREALEAQKNPAARVVLEQAQKQARAAETAFKRGELVMAQQLYRGAMRLSLRALDLALTNRKDQNLGQNEIALLQDLLQTAEQEIKGDADPRAALLIERARVLVREAEAAIARQQPVEAKWRVELARNFIEKAMRKTDRGAVTRDNIEQRYDEALQELARDIEEVRAREANKPEALQLVELATNAYKIAETLRRENTRAIRGFLLIRLAQHFLLRAETMLRETPATAAVSEVATREAMSQRLTQLETTAQEISAEGGDEACRAVRSQAMDLLKRAHAMLERGELRPASAIIEVVNDLLQDCRQRK